MSEYIIEIADYVPPFDPAIHTASFGKEIVRCKDCKWFEQDYTDGAMFDETVCWAWDNGHDYPNFTNPNGFCSRGERKEDGDD